MLSELDVTVKTRIDFPPKAIWEQWPLVEKNASFFLFVNESRKGRGDKKKRERKKRKELVLLIEPERP